MSPRLCSPILPREGNHHLLPGGSKRGGTQEETHALSHLYPRTSGPVLARAGCGITPRAAGAGYHAAFGGAAGSGTTAPGPLTDHPARSAPAITCGHVRPGLATYP